MKAYLGFKNNELNNIGFTSLIGVCNEMNVSYDSAARGKRKWINENDVIEIKEINIVKIKNRGRK